MVAVVQLPEPSRTFYPGPSGSGQGDIGESHGCGRHSQLCHVLGDTLGQDTQALVAASHHRVHTGALCWAAWAQPAAVLIVACRREPRRHVRAVQSGSPSGYRKSFCSHSEGAAAGLYQMLIVLAGKIFPWSGKRGCLHSENG